MVKNASANAEDIRDVGLIPGLGRSSAEGNGNLLQYSCLENPMDRGAFQPIVHRVTKSGHDQSNLAHTQHRNTRISPHRNYLPHRLTES